MAQTGRWRGRGRGGGSRGEGESSYNDSTQPPSIVFKIEFAQPMPDAPTKREVNDSTRGDSDAVQVPLNEPTKKRGCRPAKCTEFEKFRKHRKIPLKINEGETTPRCENATMFTTRVTWILKHHADMSYARWTDDDFELDWELKNHQLAVWKQLHKRFNAFHHELHKKYSKYGSHEEALANGTSLVEPLIWVKLCGRWGSDAFKKMSEQNKENRKRLKINHTAGRKSFVRILEEKRSRNENLVDFYKDVRWSKKKNQFVTSTTEDLYKEMVGKMDELEPEQSTNEAAASIFREVLGSRPGYARGLGEMVIPESTKQAESERWTEYAAAVERHKKEADSYKSQLEELRGDVRLLLERQLEYEKFINSYISERQSHGESHRKTHGIA
ncbi:uncharacterized protein LOC121247164 [Juglans microcarpa x Juglans regia]|uniref:uncharacterized protein LOC121247164 n=1 Tax=Juglans microcarpa x Juglans regia TaxID=2249226 RepID=UPI001B7DCA7B|nr:uncharacterized protein LOC121247164 [Juglans microcarpa x Juglans regia]